MSQEEDDNREVMSFCTDLMEIGVTFDQLETIVDKTSLRYIKELTNSKESREQLTPVDRFICSEYVKTFDIKKTWESVKDNEIVRSKITTLQKFCMILTKPVCINKIKQLIEISGVDKEYVVLGIKDTIERSSQVRPVLDRKGNQVYVETPDGKIAAAFTYDSSAVLKGYELLGKHLALWSENSKNGNDPNNTITAKMTIINNINLPEDPIQAANGYLDFMAGKNNKN